ncbi:MAG: sensor histidine kinase N-terminal domain-containing protein [Burkholderiales bacterium]|nr:sensor histidine kinase N-terminal domain-containing protein [Burkholderiales bacterium]
MRSLQARLLALVLAVTMLVWSATLVFTWRDARHEIDELLDGHLAQAASLLIAQVMSDIEEIDLEHAPLLHKDARKVAFQVWDRHGGLRLHSMNAPNEALGRGTEGLAERTVEGRRWRVFSAWDPSREYLVQVGERADVRDALARDMIGALLSPLLIALPVLALAIWFAIRTALRPLSALARAVGQRRPEHLAPLPEAGAPREVQPLIAQLNRLFLRIGASLERERRFTADAAHELRTPVAGIKAQAQVARMAASAQVRDEAIARVVAGADRAGRLVEQMLTLARLEAQEGSARQRIDLHALAAEAAAQRVPAALERDVQLELAESVPTWVEGVPGLLDVLLGNLVDNAVAHAPANTRVQLTVVRQGDVIRLRVEDQGPGIEPAERDKVFERFHRLEGAPKGGSGLGLSIVKRIADIHGASLELADAPGGGLRVELLFPAA